MEKLPTAEEFALETMQGCDLQEIETALIGFAKLHLERAKIVIAEKATAHAWLDDDGTYEATVHKSSILNAYSLDNIV